jgi:NAD(P)-dependent dehydrogenase (short-subunit alcohol dehydrogenase family)
MRERGWRVFASCRKAEDCLRLQGLGFESPLIDYADPATLASGLAEVLEATGGRLDGLFNNGAFAIPGAVEDLPRDALRSIFEVNLFGYHDLTRRVIPTMRAQGHGRIINCSSVLGLVGAKWRGAYVATKFAMEGLSDVLRLEMRDTGIKVILIEPGPITSRIRANAVPHFERWINVAASARRDEYATLIHRLYKESAPDRFELPASAVTAALAHALQSSRPKARYYVTTPTWLIGSLRRVLSTRALDRILSRS